MTTPSERWDVKGSAWLGGERSASGEPLTDFGPVPRALSVLTPGSSHQPWNGREGKVGEAEHPHGKMKKQRQGEVT